MEGCQAMGAGFGGLDQRVNGGRARGSALECDRGGG